MSDPITVSRAEFVDLLNDVYALKQSIKQSASADDHQVAMARLSLEERKMSAAEANARADIEQIRERAERQEDRADNAAVFAASVKARLDFEALGEAAAVRFHELELAKIEAAHCERIAQIRAHVPTYGPLGVIGPVLAELGLTPQQAIDFALNVARPPAQPTFAAAFGTGLAGVLPALAPFVLKYLAGQRDEDEDAPDDVDGDPSNPEDLNRAPGDFWNFSGAISGKNAIPAMLGALAALGYGGPGGDAEDAEEEFADHVGKPRAEWGAVDVARLFQVLMERLHDDSAADVDGQADADNAERGE